MSKVKISLKADGGHTPIEVRSATATAFIRFQEIGCRLIFDVKMDFTRKDRFVAGGHTKEAPSSTLRAYSLSVPPLSERALSGVTLSE